MRKTKDKWLPVETIKRVLALSASGYTCTMVGRYLGMHRQTVLDIASRRTHKYVPDQPAEIIPALRMPYVRTTHRYMPLAERLERRSVKTENCWLWMGHLNESGYGQINIDGKFPLTHRVSWELHKGSIPDGMQVLHKCDVRRCWNPEHLFLGTHMDNMRDMISKGRHRFGGRAFDAALPGQCYRGHEMTGDNVMKNGRNRMCRACYRIRYAARRAKITSAARSAS